MAHPWHDLTPGPNPPGEIHVVVEIPKGCRNKYELEKESGLFKLDRVLYSAVHYPGDYGFVPRTWFDDGDPLDVLVMVSEPSFTGCRIEARVVGAFEMRDPTEMDTKILAVPHRDPMFDGTNDLGDVPVHYLREVEHFFAIYKELEGTRSKPLGWKDRAEALVIVRESIDGYRLKFGARS